MMEEPGKSVIRPVNADGTNNPNHLIIWLDKYIGKPNECVLLKRSFFMTTDPTTGYAVNLNEDAIEYCVRSSEAIFVRLDDVQFMLRAFDNIETCFTAIKNNLDKRLFFITSGSLGKIIVPSLVANFPDKFVETQLVYIFCGNMNMIHVLGVGNPTNDWAFDYIDNVLMFNHQDDLLTRMLRDIAEYFSTEAVRLETSGQLKDARQHYHWSKRMWQRYNKIEKKPTYTEINKIDIHLAEIEQRLKEETNDEDKVAESAT